jgi:hypothetical protein
MGVPELGKPIFAPCAHVGTGGCNIYPDRPASCRAFNCLWRLGWLGGNEGWRPDRSGLVFDLLQSRIQVYQASPAELNLDLVERIRNLADRVRKKVKVERGVWLYPYGSKVGHGYDLKPPYELETVDSQWVERHPEFWVCTRRVGRNGAMGI